MRGGTQRINWKGSRW